MQPLTCRMPRAYSLAETMRGTQKARISTRTMWPAPSPSTALRSGGWATHIHHPGMSVWGTLTKGTLARDSRTGTYIHARLRDDTTGPATLGSLTLAPDESQDWRGAARQDQEGEAKLGLRLSRL